MTKCDCGIGLPNTGCPIFQDQEAQSLGRTIPLVFVSLMNYLCFISRVDGLIGMCAELSSRCFAYEGEQLKKDPGKEKTHQWGRTEGL